MIEITRTEVLGWAAAIRGMRNPMNSWEKSDSSPLRIGPNDMALMEKLSAAGSDHAKYLRMINVTCDILAPLYWWKEFDTYKIGTVANSCSTMHRIHSKEFVPTDFSHEHLYDDYECCPEEWYLEAFYSLIAVLNCARDSFIRTGDKRYWWQMIQLLPSSYNQHRTVQLNYQVLKNIYHARKDHKLDEWHTFCDWTESLPLSQLITQTT